MLNNLPLIAARCLILTVITECVFAFVSGVRKKTDFALVALANILTNPPLVVGTLLAGFFFGTKVRIITVIFAEILAVAAEALVYSKTLDFKKMKPLTISLILNAVSFAAGHLINIFTGG